MGPLIAHIVNFVCDLPHGFQSQGCSLRVMSGATTAFSTNTAGLPSGFYFYFHLFNHTLTIFVGNQFLKFQCMWVGCNLAKLFVLFKIQQNIPHDNTLSLSSYC